MDRARTLVRLSAAFVLCASALGVAGVASGSGATGAELPAGVPLGSQIQVQQAEGARIAQVLVRLESSTADPARDRAIEGGLRAIADTLRDVPLQRLVLDGLLQRIQRTGEVASASYAVYQTVPAGGVVVVVTAVAATSPGAQAESRKGLFSTGGAASLPVLYEDERALLKAIVNGGVGAYATSNSFFGYADLFTRGNLAARQPAAPGTTRWAESYLEAGLGGIGRLGDTPLYPYGAFTYLASASWGQDLYDAGTRYHGAFEQAYAGAVIQLPGTGNALNVSAGRQVYQLRQGFLISKIPGSTNLGRLGALWLGPRLAFDRTALATLKLGAISAEGVVLEPTEFPGLETRTRIAAGTVGYSDGRVVDAALTYLAVPRSQKAYLAPDGSVLARREGLRTFSPSVWITSVPGVEGLWFKGEYAHQSHEELDMSAHAYAGWIGYRADRLPWKPGISYRYASFSGDDPATEAFERYDQLLSGGQNNYVPGMLLSGVLVNSNLRTHRLTLTANPTEQTALTLEFSSHRAHELNNAGGIGPLQQLTSKDLARELDLFFNLYVGKNYYLQGLLAAALPGTAIRQAVGGGTKNWYAAQLSLYFFF